MAEKFFNMLQCVLKLLAEKRLKKNIDDTLLEKLLTLVQKCKLQSTEAYEKVIVAADINDQDSSGNFLTFSCLKEFLSLYFELLFIRQHKLKKKTKSARILDQGEALDFVIFLAFANNAS